MPCHHEAWQGYPNVTRFKRATLSTRDLLLLEKERSGKTISIQKEAYASLVRKGFPNDLQKHASEYICRLMGLDKRPD